MFIHNQYPSAIRPYNHTAHVESKNNEKPTVTWEQYFQNYRNNNFEKTYGVKKGDAQGFAEKYNLRYTILPKVTAEDIMTGNNIFQHLPRSNG